MLSGIHPISKAGCDAPPQDSSMVGRGCGCGFCRYRMVVDADATFGANRFRNS
jgi:hypothetical protein